MLVSRPVTPQSPFLGPVLPGGALVGLRRPWLLRLARSRPVLAPKRLAYLRGMSDERQILTAEQVAELLQVSVRTVEEWRRTRTGPPYRKMGRHIRYLRAEVLVWFEELAGDE